MGQDQELFRSLPTDFVFRDDNRARFEGEFHGHVRWYIDFPPPSEAGGSSEKDWVEGGVQADQSWGEQAFEWVALLVYSRMEIRVEPPYREALVELLREASRYPQLMLNERAGKRTKLTESGRRPLAIAADVVEREGVYRWSKAPGVGDAPGAEYSLFPVPSPGHYFALQEALATNRFEAADGTPFPRASLERGGVKGHAELRQVTPDEELLLPPEETEALAKQMWRQREELSDKDADALDAVSASWLRRARDANDRVAIHID